MDVFQQPAFWGIIAVVLIVVFAIFVIKSYVKKLSEGCCGSSGGDKVKKIKVKDKDKSHYPYKAILTVDGMVCQGCESKIENTLNNLEGVWAKANTSTKEVTVLMKNKIDEKTLKKTVNTIGAYTVMKYREV